MSKLTKFYLALSVVCLVAGLLCVTRVINVGSSASLYIVLPAGAVFFGLFLTCLVMEKDTALFDQDHAEGLKQHAESAAEHSSREDCGCGSDCGCHSTSNK